MSETTVLSLGRQPLRQRLQLGEAPGAGRQQEPTRQQQKPRRSKVRRVEFLTQSSGQHGRSSLHVHGIADFDHADLEMDANVHPVAPRGRDIGDQMDPVVASGVEYTQHSA
eukprot:304145-Rhodomonas_salina.2